MLAELKKLEQQKLIRPLDYQFANLISTLDSHPVIVLISALVSHELGKNNVCLLLEQLDDDHLFDLPKRVSDELISICGISVNQWQNRLMDSSVISQGYDHPAPLVFDQNRVYLHRYWEYETNVADYLGHRPPVELDTKKARTIINNLFDTGTDKQLNWQKVAAALAATRSFAVISGGPGTGKTTTVTKLLALLVELGMSSGKTPDIKLVAPTGKAAARLTESITGALKDLSSSDSVKARIPTQAGTIHRLLGVIPGNTEFRHNRSNKLHLDILVVDEASMIDLTLMSRLLDAMPDNSRIILLGDRDQLASVDAGNVLGDICMAASSENSYSHIQTEQLEYLTGYQLNAPQKTVAGDHLCMLLKSYRFHEKSGIGHLARAANSGNAGMLSNRHIDPFDDIALYPVDEAYYQQMIKQCIQGYSRYLKQIQDNTNHKDILSTFNQFQLLCALREGRFGISGLNEVIQQQLHQAGLIQVDPSSQWYEGRPVLITRNDHGMGLYNGDIGITIRDNKTNRLRVVFDATEEDNPTESGPESAGTRSFLPSRLPEHETVYAMTIHKSQGSEFAHTIMVLPDQMNPVVTRELVYTGITRAKRQLDLYCDQAILIRAINSPTARASGLQSRLGKQ